MKLLSSILAIGLLLPLSAFATSHTGTYVCENATVTVTIDLEDNGRSHFLSIENKRKDNELVIVEISGAAYKTFRGGKNLTTYSVGDQRIWFNEDGEVQYNGTIDCTKN